MDLLSIQIYVLAVLTVVIVGLLFILIKQRKEHQQYRIEKDIEISNALNEMMRQKEEFHAEQIKFTEEFQAKLAQKEEQIIQQKMEYSKEKEQAIKQAKKYALDAQRNKVKGQVSENFIPFMQGFEYQASDCHFFGNPIDYIVYNNVHRYVDGECAFDDVSIVFLEVKTGKASLNERQKAIRDAIAQGKVRFEMVRMLEDTSIITEEIVECGQEGFAIDRRQLDNNPLSRANEKWTEEEEWALVESYDNGLNYYQLAAIHKRTAQAIISRLKKMGKIA
ncbi:Holliday junction resolvase-like protein [Moraxella pluranimalium]|uniref:Holliday junction resolvase-related domain-containing protein n=1 Tax=Moraxella pluranimalium TaxID=470453 RepID=A0A1T0CPZ3_9GAMM|nr:Holliday junction resolvase-like protein [Moraxella pluranimalium]OOS24415.1 hypothetical protein B0680_04745 [Moraxella pluranimalium]